MGWTTTRCDFAYKNHRCEKRHDPESAKGTRGAEDWDNPKERGEMNWKKMIIRSMGIAALILLAGCSGSRSAATSAAPGQQAPTASNIAPPVEVILADGTSVTLVYATIAKLPLQLLSISGKNEQGPTVPDFLSAAGVTDFSQVTLIGLENRTLTFTRDQLNDGIILALREHPRAVNLMSPNIPVEQWVLHVFKVEVQ
jgi:hypothetical protein